MKLIRNKQRLIEPAEFLKNVLDYKREARINRKHFTMEHIVGLLREADVKLSQGDNALQICRELGIPEQRGNTS